MPDSDMPEPNFVVIIGCMAHIAVGPDKTKHMTVQAPQPSANTVFPLPLLLLPSLFLDSNLQI